MKKSDIILQEVYFEQGSLFPEETKNDIERVKKSIVFGTYLYKFPEEMWPSFHKKGASTVVVLALKDMVKEVKAIQSNIRKQVVNLSADLELAEDLRKYLENPFTPYINKYSEKDAQAIKAYSPEPPFANPFPPAQYVDLQEFAILIIAKEGLENIKDQEYAKSYRAAMEAGIAKLDYQIKRWTNPSDDE